MAKEGREPVQAARRFGGNDLPNLPNSSSVKPDDAVPIERQPYRFADYNPDGTKKTPDDVAAPGSTASSQPPQHSHSQDVIPPEHQQVLADRQALQAAERAKAEKERRAKLKQEEAAARAAPIKLTVETLAYAIAAGNFPPEYVKAVSERNGLDPAAVAKLAQQLREREHVRTHTPPRVKKSEEDAA